MSSTQEATGATDTEIEEKAQQIAEAMDLTIAEFNARLYKRFAETYAAEVADTDGEQAVEENRASTIEGMYDGSVEEVAGGADSGAGTTLTGGRDVVDAYGTGTEGNNNGSTEGTATASAASAPHDADDESVEEYGTGVEGGK